VGERSAIQWCDHTFNPWVGCEKVSPGCAHCYAETLVTGRMARGGTWGADGHRERTSASTWAAPFRYERNAARFAEEHGRRQRVFCASLADVFEPRPELDPWRDDLFALIDATRSLDWLILTKRPEVACEWFYELRGAIPPNIWLGTSIENARHTYRADILREIPAAVRFISAEPLLGSLYRGARPGHRQGEVGRKDLADARPAEPDSAARTPGGSAPLDLAGIDWVIVGGESGGRASRPMHPEWADEIRDACLSEDYVGPGEVARTGPAFLFKQWGSWAPVESGGVRTGDVCLSPDGERYDVGPDYVCASNETEGTWLRYAGANPKSGGRLLDSREWNEFPS